MANSSLASLAIYALSAVCSMTKTRIATAELTALHGSKTTLITIPGIRTGWRAGQHVRIRVPSLGFPLGLEAHPFTIASAPDGEGLVLLCKSAGDWTERLFQRACFGAFSIVDGGEDREAKAHVTVIIEGPYGGLGNMSPASSSGVMVVAGGSGISHALSIAHDLMNQVPSGVVRPRTVDLVWVVRHESEAKPLVATLSKMVVDAHSYEESCLEGRMQMPELPPPVALRVHIYLTRVPVSSPITLLMSSGKTAGPDVSELIKSGEAYGYQPSARTFKLAYLASTGTIPPLSSTMTLDKKRRSNNYSPLSCIKVHKLRPDFDGIINMLADEAIDRGKRERVDPSGLCITACGPLGMVNCVRDAVRTVEGCKRRDVGGIELEEEFFGF